MNKGILEQAYQNLRKVFRQHTKLTTDNYNKNNYCYAGRLLGGIVDDMLKTGLLRLYYEF